MAHSLTYNRECIYRFTTQSGLQYSVSFEEDPDLSGIPENGSCKRMLLSLSEKKSRRTNKDPQIEPTVIAIILDYLKLYKNDVIGYICLNTNGQGKARQKLFSRWFTLYNPGDFRYQTKESGNETAIFIFNEDNVLAQRLIDNFNL